MNNETLVIVRQNNYWGSGKDLAEARNNYKRASGKYPTSNASIIAYTGTPEETDKITVDDFDGTINYPKTISRVVLQEAK